MMEMLMTNPSGCSHLTYNLAMALHSQKSYVNNNSGGYVKFTPKYIIVGLKGAILLYW